MVKTVVCMSVGTGGAAASDRQSLASALAYSLFQRRPDEIIFFVSKESYGTVDLISSEYKEKYSEELPSHKFVILDRVDDFEDCFINISKFIDEKKKDECEVFLDYTSGTKTMTMVLGVLAVLYHCTLLLTEGKRDEHGKVHPRSERMLEQRLFAVYDKMLFESVVQMFHAYRFAEALDTLEKITDHKCKDVMIFVCRAFQYWDQLEYQDSVTVFGDMDIDKAKMLIPDIANKSAFVRRIVSYNKHVDKARAEEMDKRIKDEYKCKAKVREMKNLVKKYKMILADLLCNAQRRIEEGKYEDAVARLYRSVELVAQIKLVEQAGVDDLAGAGLDERKILEHLPEEIKGKYRDKAVNGKFKFGAKEKYELLTDLGKEYGWSKARDIYRGIQEDLEKRNRSVLAHGIMPVTKEDAEKMLENVDNIAEMALGDGTNTMREFRRGATFPRIEWK